MIFGGNFLVDSDSAEVKGGEGRERARQMEMQSGDVAVYGWHLCHQGVTLNIFED